MRKRSFFVYQHDSMQCGMACLQMVCRWFGKDYSDNDLSSICLASPQGVSMLGISEAASKLGLKATSGRIELKSLCEVNLPCILHWNQNHFVVLYKIKNGHNFYIADPAKGLIEYTIDEFRTHWVSLNSNDMERGIAMLLEPTEEFGKFDCGQKQKRRSFKFLMGYINQYRKYFFQILLGLLLCCLLQLIMPFLTQSIVDVGIKNKDIDYIWLILLGELIIVIGKTSTDFIRRWLLLHISMRINISLVSDFFIKLLKLPMMFFDTKQLGDLMQRMNDHDRVQSFLTNQTMGVMFTSFSFIVFGAVLFIYDNLIFFVFLVGSILYGLWISIFLRRRKILDYEMFEKEAINQNKTYQFITSMQEIKLQDCEQRRRWEWEDVQADLFQVKMMSLKLQQTQEAGGICINELKNIIITILAAKAVINGQMTLGMMLAVQYITGQLNSPVEQLMSFIYAIQDVKISLERINEVHNSKDEEYNDALADSFPSTDKSIEIDNVDFKYVSYSLTNTLQNVSFDIAQGKVTAIVGASGSGKSTLIKLILGYYRVNGGGIYISGRNINEYNLKWWRKQCGVVMQGGVIFSESIARNIAVNDGDIDIKRLEQAACIANIHEYIIGLPLKYNTIIGRDGVGLSEGQKQRILIARAVYKKPDYIFLDEATNSLDTKNERAIVENLKEFYKGRTVVVVAHRLSTVKNADQIIVVDKGKIVEIGNNSSLIEKRGIYFNLVRNQLELGN